MGDQKLMKNKMAVRQSGFRPMCLDVVSWRTATPVEIGEFLKRKRIERAKSAPRKAQPSVLSVRRHLVPVDVYCYLKARFGEPNGIQNYLRRDTSDNLIHWEFMLKAGDGDVLISGKCREVQLIVSAVMTDEDWHNLILAIKSDYKRVANKKSLILKSLEHWIVFPNRYVAIANLCADLHSQFVENMGGYTTYNPKLGGRRRWKRVLQEMDRHAEAVYRSCLQLSVFTPILAEAFINLLILAFCKPELRANPKELDDFIRSKIHTRLSELTSRCDGFAHPVKRDSTTFKNFLKVMNKRNDTIHGNHNPERERIESVYFEGTRPLFVEPGDQIGRFFESLERQYCPDAVVRDYEHVHEFLADLTSCLKPQLAKNFQRVAEDPYPGFDTRRKKMGGLFPGYYNEFYLQGVRFDDELSVTWAR